jgi:hypothetical protein
MQKIILIVGLLLSTSSLFGTNIMLTGFDMNRTMGVAFNVDGEEYVAGAGVGLLEVDGSAIVESFCLDLFAGISYFELFTADSVEAYAFHANGGSAAWLMDSYLGNATDAAGGAALQLAIWDMIHDGGDGFEAGRIQANTFTDSSVLQLASAWVADAKGKTSTAALVFVPASGTPEFQERLYLRGEEDCEPNGDVPEPGTLAMLAVGAVGIFSGSRRRS